jgi:hypothetical protein
MEGGGPNRDRSLGDLLGQLTGDLASLVRKESQLVRAEFSEKLNQAGRGVGEVFAGALLLLAALLVLLQALVLALSKIMDPALASVLVGGAVAVIGYLLLRGGVKALDPDNLKPDRSARQIKKNVELMKGSPR